LADPDIWTRPAVKSDGTEYYEYMLLYTDDALVISDFGERFLRTELGSYFELKEESIGPPDIYLGGGKMRKFVLRNNAEAWSFNSSQYVRQSAVTNVEVYLAKQSLKLPTRANTPLAPNYRPEVDVSPAELEPGVDGYLL
jgi:hypothetical protein